MRAKSGWTLCFVLCLLSMLTACHAHPPRYIDGVMRVTQTHAVADARTRRVEGWPCLRVDAALLDRADRALAEQDLQQARALAAGFLDDAHRLSMDVARQELARLDDAGWSELAHDYFAYDGACDPSARVYMTDAFVNRCDQQYWFLRHSVQEAHDVKAVRAVVERVLERVQIAESERGRTLRQVLLSPFAIPTNLAVNNIRDDLKTRQRIADFDQAVRYARASVDAEGFTGSDEEWQLLVKHAPVFYQEKAADRDYPPTADQIGRVFAVDPLTIEQDITQPVVYAYARTVYLNGQDHRQLIYTVWYPQRPGLTPNDPEAGKFDGATVRLTLDRRGAVAFAESSANCGCYYALFPAEHTERAAAGQFGAPLAGHDFSLEQEVPDKYAVDVSGLIEGAQSGTLAIWTGARSHLVLDISADRPGATRIVSEAGYALRAYDELESLPLPDGGRTSMFHPNGLVKGAERAEGLLLAATGMLSAGQPRQRGTQLILFDAYDFDDPRLLEKVLRLPSDF